MFDKAFDDCMAPLKFILDWFLASKVLERFHDPYLLMMTNSFLMKILVKQHFSVTKWIFSKQILIKLTLLMIMILMILILFRILAWRNNFGKLKVLKQGISKELLPVAWHPTRWQDWYLLESEKKQIHPIFTDKVGKC